MNKEAWYQKRLEAMKAEARERAWAAQQGIPTEVPAGVRVTPLDLDFLLMAGFAMIMDGIDIFFEIFHIAKPGGMFLDVFTFAILGWWVYQRTSQIVKNKQARIKAAQIQIRKVSTELQKKLQKQMAEEALKKAAKRPLRRAFLRGAIFLLGEMVSFLGLIPFWTIMVVETLREKG